MRFFPLLVAALSVAIVASVEIIQDEGDVDEQIFVESDDVEPQFLAAAAWPEDNPFGHVVNGERNTINVLVENRLKRNATVLSIAGAFYQPDSENLVKNLSATPYGIEMMEGLKFQLPYTFFSEFKPGDLRMSLWVEYLDQGEKHRAIAYESIITVVEPEISWFDLKLHVMSTYLVALGLVGGLGYIAYLSFVPQPKKSRRPAVSAPVGTVTASGSGYQEEWIPEHHLKNRRKSGVVSSGDDLSGGETSGTEGKRRKGKK